MPAPCRGGPRRAYSFETAARNRERIWGVGESEVVMNRPEQHIRARLAVAMAGGALVAALFPMAGVALAATTPTVSSIARVIGPSRTLRTPMTSRNVSVIRNLHTAQVGAP